MHINSKYRTLFFDLDNTLWDFDKNSYSALKVTYCYFNIDKSYCNFEQFYKTYIHFNEKFWDDYRKKLITKKELVKKRFELTLKEYNINGINPVDVNDYYLDVMPDQNILVEGTIDILNYLKAKKYNMHIITNGFMEVQHLKLKNSGLRSYFDKIYISETLKAPKPAKEIFEYAIKSSNARKNESVMIGDSWDVDVIGALNFGIDQVHFNNNGSAILNKYESEIIKNSRTSTFRINSLNQLKTIL